MRRTLKLHLPLLAHYNWQKPQLDTTKLILSVISLSFIPCPQSNLYTDRYNMLLKIRGGPSGGPWTRSTWVVHGPGPCFVYTRNIYICLSSYRNTFFVGGVLA